MNFTHWIRWTLAAMAGLVMAVSVHAQGAIKTEHFMLQSSDPALKVYVRNKYLEGKTAFTSDKVVLFVHGATYPAETGFDINLPGGSWLDFVAKRGFDTYMVDVRGYGRSDRPATMDNPAADNPPFATTADAVADVSAAVNFILKRRGITKLNLVGWSWGTTIMATYTTQNNDTVNKLVLYAPLWIVREPPPITGAGNYRTVQAEPARQRGARGIPPAKVEEISPKAWFDQWWSENLQSDPNGAKQNPPVLRAPNGVIKDLAEIWMKGQSTFDPANIRVPTMLILAEWDQDTPLYMAQEVFAKMTNAPSKRHVVLGEGTHAIALEKNRMQLINQVQLFLEE
jgi:pimeloyl-ACP methyl ester carboxylesterase